MIQLDEDQYQERIIQLVTWSGYWIHCIPRLIPIPTGEFMMNSKNKLLDWRVGNLGNPVKLEWSIASVITSDITRHPSLIPTRDPTRDARCRRPSNRCRWRSRKCHTSQSRAQSLPGLKLLKLIFPEETDEFWRQGAFCFDFSMIS